MTASFEATAKQQELMSATEPEILFTGGRGGGGSIGAQRWLAESELSLLLVEDRHSMGDAFTGNRELHRMIADRKCFVAPVSEWGRFRGYRFERIAFDVPADHLAESAYKDVCKMWPNSRILAVSVPPWKGVKHWMYRHFFGQPNRRVIHATVADNPYLSNNAAYRAMLEIQRKELKQRWLDGSWIESGSPLPIQ